MGSTTRRMVSTFVNMLHVKGANRRAGDVNYLSQANASADNIAFIQNNQAIIKIDNTSDVQFNFKRNSVRYVLSPPTSACSRHNGALFPVPPIPTALPHHA